MIPLVVTGRKDRLAAALDGNDDPLLTVHQCLSSPASGLTKNSEQEFG